MERKSNVLNSLWRKHHKSDHHGENSILSGANIKLWPYSSMYHSTLRSRMTQTFIHIENKYFKRSPHDHQGTSAHGSTAHNAKINHFPLFRSTDKPYRASHIVSFSVDLRDRTNCRISMFTGVGSRHRWASTMDTFVVVDALNRSR